MRWSDGSYLEDQDHWWLSGIHRDVLLLSKPQVTSWVLLTNGPAASYVQIVNIGVQLGYLISLYSHMKCQL
jgi:hypothetical protein